jgi:hypothetical protein
MMLLDELLSCAQSKFSVYNPITTIYLMLNEK